jgi:hypothetical protein
MNSKLFLSVLLCIVSLFFSCKKETTKAVEPKLIFKFKFDPDQERLNNIGQPETMPAGHAGQSPSFNSMSAHYLELAPTALTALGKGVILYKAAETTTGGSNAIDFEKSSFAGNNETFFEAPLKNVAPGEYDWLRLSLAYQNYGVKYYVDTVISGITVQQEFSGTVASFIGFNTYIENYKIKDQNVAVNANRKQGYWGFETMVNFGGVSYPFSTTGQAPEGATTVVNPLFATSPIPPGSCAVTSDFPGAGLIITGKETTDIVIEISLSTNKSFEWTEVVNDGKWAPTKGEQVVDMGIRGMKLKFL